jgi:RNA-binding protein YhbY
MQKEYDAIITNMAKLLEVQQKRELVAVDMIKAAILAEREACAKLCEDLDAWNMDDPASTAAKAIRARGQA